MSNFFDDFFAPKTVFWKNHYWGGSEIDCFEPIFGFLMQFCFQKHRSGTWDPKDMFSAPSGHSATKVSMYSTYVIWPLFSHTIHYKAVTVIFFSSFWDQIHFDDVIKKLVYLLTMTAHMSRNFNMSSLSTVGYSRFFSNSSLR